MAPSHSHVSERRPLVPKPPKSTTFVPCVAIAWPLRLSKGTMFVHAPGTSTMGSTNTGYASASPDRATANRDSVTSS